MNETNLIYNGDFSKGTESWSGNNLTVTNGEATLTGNLNQTIMIPVSSSRRYRLTFDLKVNTNSGQSFYIALYPYDSEKELINVSNTNKLSGSTNTTLAAELKNGDTTVSLASSTGWEAVTYANVGICDLLAYGYNRASHVKGFNAISGNTVTLKSAWDGGTFAVGTKVAEFRDGSTYYYPWNSSSSKLPSEWTTYTVEFNGGNSIRYGCKYFTFHTLGYQHNYSIRNICIECISDYQTCLVRDYKIAPQFFKTGIVQAPFFNEVGINVRYIKDTINGSTANDNNHWCELQVFNSVNENIALGAPFSIDGTTYRNSVVTDGNTNSSHVGVNSGTKSLLFDMKEIEPITKIKIWHYYPDGRTYHDNVTEVSVDGTHWITVYKGEKPETPNGNEIILSPMYMSIYESGDIWANDFIEY